LNAGSSPRKLFGWKRFSLAAAALIFLVLVLGPRHTREKVLDIGLGWKSDKPNNSPPTTVIPKPSPGSPPESNPTSPETDPDRSATVHCKEPFSPERPLVQYALMIDAGSTGSRIHIYKFHNCLAQPTYEYEVFRHTTPGLSHYAKNPISAAESLDELMNDALEVVPEHLRSCTPVAVKATAGLRLLGTKDSTNILQAVENRLASRYPFALNKEDGVVILDGKDEGVFAWITTNYLMHAFGSVSPHQQSTYAVLDLGGASTQIVFKPRAAGPETQLMEGEHKYVLEFGGSNHTLYQHSYLGYGLKEARKSVHRLAQFMSTFNKEPQHNTQSEIANPCLSKGTSQSVDLEDKPVMMTGADIGSFQGCKRLVELVMAKDAICLVKPCSFNGIYQPSILDSFPAGEIMLLSYFYDRIAPLIDTSSSTLPSFPIKRIGELAEIVCRGPESWASHFGSNREVMEELRDRPEHCLDLSFMYTLLRLGYEFTDDRRVTIAKQIDSTERGWALGAGIALVGGHVQCVA